MYSKLCETSNTERFAKVINLYNRLTILAKRFLLDDSHGSEYVSVNRQNMRPIARLFLSQSVNGNTEA